jgi:NAD(P)-dependent dehydrogenase (short-subunit alcohol dehydrogenase family)
MTFHGRNAIVTGAGGGMGLRIATDLAAAGATVTALDIKPRPPQLGDSCDYEQFDITQRCQVRAAIQRAYERRGRLDYVVNAAGVGWFDRDGSLVDIDPGVWDRVLDVNLTAAMHVSRCAIPLMRGNGAAAGEGPRASGGALVHIASVAGLRNSDGAMDAYQVAKAGLISMSRAIALTYGPDNVRSNTICPGAILTPMIEPLYQADPSRRHRMEQRTPLRRLGTPADVSAACLFLLSDAASFITGTDLVVDGGWVLALA